MISFTILLGYYKNEVHTVTNAIAIRVYQILIFKKGNSTPIPFSSEGLPVDPPTFINTFVNDRSDPTQNSELERSWYFEVKENGAIGSLRGYIHYGTYGFESNFVDVKTKKNNYRRKTSDVEEIPLFFEFWTLEKSSFALAAFQSFQGRSCISLVIQSMKSNFEKSYPNYTLSYRKLLPNDSIGNLYKAPVKKLRLIKRKAHSDITDKYFDNSLPVEVDFEVSISARRNRSLGDFGSIKKSLRTAAGGVVVYDGVNFSEAVAEIRTGGKVRKVGIFGVNGDAGVIDLTEDIVKGPDGHPTYESIALETGSILEDFYNTISKSKS